MTTLLSSLLGPSAVVTLTDVQTVSNKTLTNTSIGSTGPATGAFTDLSATGNTTLGDAPTDVITMNGKLAASGITFNDGTTQNSAGTTQGFSIAMSIALG